MMAFPNFLFVFFQVREMPNLPFVAGVFPSVSCLRLLLLPAGTLPFPYLILVPAVHFFGIARLFPSNLKAIPT